LLTEQSVFGCIQEGGYLPADDLQPQPAQPTTTNFFGWWLIDQPIYLWNLTVKISYHVLIYFSIPTLLRTLFAPWKRDVYVPVNASLDLVIKTIFDNLISRAVGFVVRFFTIIIGLLATIISFCLMVVILFFWLCLPVIAALIIYWGLK